MAARVKVDERGRITLPKEIREALGIEPGDVLSLTVSGDRIVVEKARDPFERLAQLLGDLGFSRRLRVAAEREAARDAAERRARLDEESAG